MAHAYLRSRLEERAQLSDLIKGELDKAAESKKDLTADQNKMMAKWEGRAAELDAEIEHLSTVDTGNKNFMAMAGRVSLAEENDEKRKADKRTEPAQEVRKSAGLTFIESDAFKSYRGRGSMAPVDIDLDALLETRAAITTADLPIQPYLSMSMPPTTTTPLLNLIGHERVSSGSVEYIKWGVSAGNAEVVPEGGLKPEADFATTSATDSLDTYAWYKAITRQALEDYPRIRSIIETKLRTGIANALEAAAADTLVNATDVETVTNDDLLSGIRLAIADIQEKGFSPNAVLLNPVDFANLDIAAAESSNSGPTSYGRFWGLQPVYAGAVPEGTAYLGDFSEGETYFDRGVASVFMTDSHADFFLRNQLIILAETRALFAITDANALAKVTTGATVQASANAFAITDANALAKVTTGATVQASAPAKAAK